MNFSYEILDLFSRLINAVLIFLIGYIVACVNSFLFRNFLKNIIKLDNLLEKYELNNFLFGASPTYVITHLSFWWTICIFLGESARQLNLYYPGQYLMNLLLVVPDIYFAVFILFGGLLLAEYFSKKIKELHINKYNFSFYIRWLIIFFTVLISLDQFSMNSLIYEDILKLIAGSSALIFSISYGIIIGLGMQKKAKVIFKNFF
ncbi:hypothetical protein GF327_02530 [Candidatus Woesearchaeota archaeon]|nr:hypothetical protein [Candidatus Woesearchaeota archaeon]